MGMFLLIFLGVFAIIVLLATAFLGGNAKEEKQIRATLDSALSTQSKEMREQILNLRKTESFSAIPWVNKHLSAAALGPALQNLLNQANLKWNVGTVLTATGALGIGSAFIAHLRVDNLLIISAIGIAFSTLPFAFIHFKRGKRFTSFIEGLPEALDMMVSGLRSGQSLNAAMGLVSRECSDPIGVEFRTCFEEQNFGLELKTALANFTTRMPIQDLRIVATAIMIQKESGGNLAEVLDKTSHIIRERFRLQRQVATFSAQGRLSGIILTLLPVGLGIALYFLNPEMMSLLWKRDLGIKLLWASSIMIVIGGLIIRKLVNMEV